MNERVSDRVNARRRNQAVGGAAALGLVLATAWLVTSDGPGGVFRDGFEGDGDGGAPVDPCTGPLVNPAGWVVLEKSWADAFSSPGASAKPFPFPSAPNATYPNSVGNPVPLPGYQSYHRSGSHVMFAKGQIIAIPFTPTPDLTVNMTWDTAQSGPYYTQPRPADSMFLGISPCRGDLRSDPLCARASGMDSLFYTTRADAGGSACRVEANRQYFLNVAMVNPTDGLTPGEHTCSETAPNSAHGCDVQIRHNGF